MPIIRGGLTEAVSAAAKEGKVGVYGCNRGARDLISRGFPAAKVVCELDTANVLAGAALVILTTAVKRPNDVRRANPALNIFSARVDPRQIRDALLVNRDLLDYVEPAAKAAKKVPAKRVRVKQVRLPVAPVPTPSAAQSAYLAETRAEALRWQRILEGERATVEQQIRELQGKLLLREQKLRELGDQYEGLKALEKAAVDFETMRLVLARFAAP